MAETVLHGKVAIVTGANLSEGAPGGTRTYVLGLTRFLVARGISVDLITNGPAGSVPPTCRVLMVSDQFTPRSLVFQRRLRSWARRVDLSRVRIMHLQRPDDLVALLGFRHLPTLICTLHGNPKLAVRRRHGRVQSLGYGLVESRTLREFQALIAVDEGTAGAYRQSYPTLAARIRVIPVAIDETVFYRNDTVPRDHGGPPLFLYAGRLSAEKRVSLIVDAVRMLSGEDAHLMIAGSGPEAETLRERARGSPTTFLGNVAQSHLADLYRAADALVLASEYEGLPTVALEALASGCPVVAVAADWSKALSKISDHVILENEKLLHRGLQRALELRRFRDAIQLPPQFGWDVVGKQVLETYRSAGFEVLR